MATAIELPTLRAVPIVKMPTGFGPVRIDRGTVVSGTVELISSNMQLKATADVVVQAVCASLGPMGAAVGFAYSLGSTVAGFFSSAFSSPPPPPAPSIEGINAGDFQVAPFKNEDRGVILAHVLSSPSDAVQAQAQSEGVLEATIDGLRAKAMEDWRSGVSAIYDAIRAGRKWNEVTLNPGVTIGGLAAFAGRMNAKDLFTFDNGYLADSRAIVAVSRLAEAGARREYVKDVLYYYFLLRTAEGYRNLAGSNCVRSRADYAVWYNSSVTKRIELAVGAGHAQFPLTRPAKPSSTKVGLTTKSYTGTSGICKAGYSGRIPIDQPHESPFASMLMGMLDPYPHPDPDTGIAAIAVPSMEMLQKQAARLEGRNGRIAFSRWYVGQRWSIAFPKNDTIVGAAVPIPLEESPSEALAFAIQFANRHPTWHADREREARNFGLIGHKPDFKKIRAAVKLIRERKQKAVAAVKFARAFSRVKQAKTKKMIKKTVVVGGAVAVGAFLLLR